MKKSVFGRTNKLAVICPRRDLDGISFLFMFLSAIQKIFFFLFIIPKIHGIGYQLEKEIVKSLNSTPTPAKKKSITLVPISLWPCIYCVITNNVCLITEKFLFFVSY